MNLNRFFKLITDFFATLFPKKASDKPEPVVATQSQPEIHPMFRRDQPTPEPVETMPVETGKKNSKWIIPILGVMALLVVCICICIVGTVFRSNNSADATPEATQALSEGGLPVVEDGLGQEITPIATDEGVLPPNLTADDRAQINALNTCPDGSIDPNCTRINSCSSIDGVATARKDSDPKSEKMKDIPNGTAVLLIQTKPGKYYDFTNEMAGCGSDLRVQVKVLEEGPLKGQISWVSGAVVEGVAK